MGIYSEDESGCIVKMVEWLYIGVAFICMGVIVQRIWELVCSEYGSIVVWRIWERLYSKMGVVV